jgi:hypothetical protein
MTTIIYLAVFILLSLIYIAAVDKWEGKVVKGTRNALFLVQKGRKHLFPDFYTFSHMGFNLSSIVKIPDDELGRLPTGEILKVIPVFRPEDFMYHQNCEDPNRMVRALKDMILLT